MLKGIEYDENGVTLSFHGQITSREILDANTEIINHPGFAASKYQLWVCMPVDDFLLSTNDIQKLTDQDHQAAIINPTLRVAIVSDSPLVFGFGRMYEAFSQESPWEIMIFYNLEEAREWIEGDMS